VPEESQVLGLDRHELVALLRAAQGHDSRAYVLIALMAYNGLRVSEVLNADASDHDLQRGVHTLTVRRKGGKVVVIPLADTVAEAVVCHLAGRRSGPLVQSRTGRRLDRGTAGHILRQVAAEALPAERAATLHPHVLRHSWVAGLLDAGVALHEVQRAASHASPTTTMRYDRSRQEISREHPTFRLAAWLEDPARALGQEGSGSA
jgi:integrase